MAWPQGIVEVVSSVTACPGGYRSHCRLRSTLLAHFALLLPLISSVAHLKVLALPCGGAPDPPAERVQGRRAPRGLGRGVLKLEL